MLRFRNSNLFRAPFKQRFPRRTIENPIGQLIQSVETRDGVQLGNDLYRGRAESFGSDPHDHGTSRLDLPLFLGMREAAHVVTEVALAGFILVTFKGVV